MSFEMNKRVPQDRSQISIIERYEVEYWTERFNVSPERLRDAVNKAGKMALEVEQYLRGSRQ